MKVKIFNLHVDSYHYKEQEILGTHLQAICVLPVHDLVIYGLTLNISYWFLYKMNYFAEQKEG